MTKQSPVVGTDIAHFLANKPLNFSATLDALHEIRMVETRENAHNTYDRALISFREKYAKAVECLAKIRESMLAIYEFPSKHWVSIRTTSPIESAFATVRLRTSKTRNYGSRNTTLAADE